MPRCCLASFVSWGFKSGFALSEAGAQHTCSSCGRIYAKVAPTPGEAAVWTLINEDRVLDDHDLRELPKRQH